MSINPEIFKAYDIRGSYPKQINEETAFLVGVALAKRLKGTIIVGHDVRVSSPRLYEALFHGLLHVQNTSRKQLNFIPVGLISTPMLYFLTTHFKASGGVVITASHNPKEDNGIKMVAKSNQVIPPADILADIQKLKPIPASDRFSGPLPTIDTKPLYRAYAQYLASYLSLARPLTVVFDCSNGAVSAVLPQFLKALPKTSRLKTILINAEPDGDFPAHGPNPLLPGSMDELKKTVKEYHADLGIIFDGDGDRIMFVDNAGNELPSGATLTLLARNTKGKLIIDVRSKGFLVQEYASAAKREIIDSEVGHRFIKEKMKSHRAEFGGEASGHYYFKEFFGVDGDLFPAIMMLNSVSRLEQGAHQWLKSLPQYHHSGELNFKLKDAKAQRAVLKRVEQSYKKTATKLMKLDGVRLEFPNWWANVRTSNTEPLVRLNVEADSDKLLKEKVKELTKLIKG